MRVVVFGAGGRIGSRITDELLRRGHTVREVARPGRGAGLSVSGRPTVIADVTSPARVAEAVRGADAVISAVGPRAGDDASVVEGAAAGLLAGLRQAGVHRLIVVGGAGGLEVSPGVRLAETERFPAAGKTIAEAHRQALETYRNEPEVEWTVVSPAELVEPGVRTGRYRAGGEQLLVDASGQSRISAEDYAVAVVDELETPRHVRRRFTVASA
ncbi:MAG TPA: NAD(P)H-binding protein [Thermoplasmata archaeon]|nr:NAD(P)H-binding protein [Thermoplasmata archaeon]